MLQVAEYAFLATSNLFGFQENVQKLEQSNEPDKEPIRKKGTKVSYVRYIILYIILFEIEFTQLKFSLKILLSI